MKHAALLFISWFVAAFSYKAMAQEQKVEERKIEKRIIEKGEKGERMHDGADHKTEQIIIEKKGDKDVNLTVQITNDKVMINGKPLVEFNDDNVVIHKKQMIIRKRKDAPGFPPTPPAPFAFTFDEGSKVFLGVSTEKAANGVVIKEVTPGSGAAGAGLQVEDVILKVDKKKIGTPQELFDEVNEKSPGEEVKITYSRQGKEKTVKARLQERKERSFSMNNQDGYHSFSMPDMNTFKHHELERRATDMALEGMQFASGMGRPRMGLNIQDTENESGVQILEVTEGSPAASAGMAKGDIITEIAGEKVKNTDDAREALADASDKSTYTIKANRNNVPMSFEVRIPKKLKKANL